MDVGYKDSNNTKYNTCLRIRSSRGLFTGKETGFKHDVPICHATSLNLIILLLVTYSDNRSSSLLLQLFFTLQGSADFGIVY